LAGLLDTLCYAGSSLAGILLGAVSEKHGWESVLVILFVSALAASTICLTVSLITRKNSNK
jgi:sugar phosphate permease